MKSIAFAAMALSLAACGHSQRADVSNNQATRAAASAEAAPTAAPTNVATHAEANEPSGAEASATHRPVPEPKGPIDPKSVEAAGQVVQHFGALVESNRYIEAGKLWGDPDAAATFMHKLRPGIHVEIGDLGGTEGAAGSIYTTVPVVFYDTGFRRPAKIILRRVNDVPGSTAAQRRWHIERIDWTDSGMLPGRSG